MTAKINIKVLFALLLGMGLAYSASSSANEYLVKKVLSNKALLEAQNSSDLEMLSSGDSLTIHFKQGGVCELPISQIKENKIMVNTAGCEKRTDLIVGQKVSDKPISTTGNRYPSSEPTPEDPAKWRFAIGLGQNLYSGDGEFNEGTVSGSGVSLSFKMTMKLENATSIILEGRKLPVASWGYLGGLNYELARSIKSGTITINGTTNQVDGGGDKLQFATLYGSVAYRWQDVYLPFGININVVKWNTSASVKVSNGSGVQLGVGWLFNDNLALELQSWVTSFSFIQSEGGLTLDAGRGIFPSLRVMAKYVF